MAPVVQNQQARIYGTCYLYIYIINVIHGLVERSIGIKVLTELDTYALQILL